MALSRKTKNNRTKISSLKKESPSKREYRLKKQRERASKLYSQLSRESREQLIKCTSVRAKYKRDTELLTTRTQRLEKMRKHAESIRGLESPSSRSMRLKQMREHAESVRELESPSSRSMRLEQVRELVESVRELESPSSRTMRLEQMRELAESVRELESPCTRSKRLEQMRGHAEIVRELESPYARSMRLEQMREHAKGIRELESKSARSMRLEQMLEHAESVRELESPSSRSMRLEIMREHAESVRELESPSSRSIRLERIREHAKGVRELESPSSRSMRLEQMRERAERVRELPESPSSHILRLEGMREHAMLSRANESPLTREQRLTTLRTHSCVRRQLFANDDATFHDVIFQVADVECYCCKKLLYEKQSRSVLTASIRVMPPDTPDRIICCHRCANKLSKNQSPSNSFWNNMVISPAPQELDCLSEMELLLVSRIKPFMKIVRLSGRYGQLGFKGQAIVCAQQVDEAIEQLPLLDVANAGICIVSENLENVSNNRRFSVDVEKIKRALNWLVRNNHLYSDVKINSNISNQELQSSVMEAVVTLLNEEHVRDDLQNNFKPLGNDKHILRGSFHQGSERFEVGSRNRQCTANAATAIAYSCTKPLDTWASSDLDCVLLAGNTYFNQCMSRLVVKPPFLNTEELLPSVSVARTEIKLNILVDVIIGVVDSSAPSDILEGYFPSLSSGIESFFSSYEKGIITCQTNIAVALMKLNDAYYLFDSHSRGPQGYVAHVRGASMLMKFPNQSTLCQHLMVVLQVRGHRNMQFSITSVNASLNEQLIVLSHNDSPNEKNHSENQDINLLDEGHNFDTTALIPIDINIPNLTEVMSNTGGEERCIPIYELKRKTAPPVSLLREKRAEELAWVKLFPNGRNGLGEDRPISITPLDYYQTRLMSADKRFQINEYMFYALSAVELFKAQQNVSVCGRLRQDGAEPTDIIQNVHLVMRNIRGTSAYWHKSYTDLLATVKNLGPPHWYLTLSCNDLNWPDMLNALLVADGRPNYPVENLTFLEKQRLVEAYPVTLSRHFMLRFNTLFGRLRGGNSPILGKNVVDYWWRVEFQLRGSPHIHMVLWCADMPSFESAEGIQLLEQVVTCEVPDIDDDSELHNLVVQLQIHRHTQTCYKNDKNICRFGFPRPVSDQSKILDVDQATRNGGRFYILKRNDSETMINCYNPRLLKLWRANVDIQPCVSALGVAYYISKHISKAEPAEISRSMRQAIQNVRARRSESNSGRLIFAVQNAILTHREISANECAFRLCHLKLRDSSRKCVFVNTCMPEQRYRMLNIDSENCEPYKNVFDRYVHRPLSLEDLSLGEFAIWYDVVSSKINFDEDDQDADVYEIHNEDVPTGPYIRLQDNLGRMRKRNRPAVLRTRYFTLASDPDAYYYSLLLTHVPFRSEEELLSGYDSTKAAFFAKKNQLRPLQEGFDATTMIQAETEIQQAISRIVAENLATEISEQQNMSQNVNTLPQPIENVLDGVGYAIIDDVEESNDNGMSDNDFQRAVASLNSSQRQLFQNISQKLLDVTNLDQILIFVTGGAGTGKTFTLKVITEQIERLSHTDIGKSIAVTAPTGVAARLIGGRTLHSTFALPIENGRAETLRPLTGERLQKERQKWRSINWLIIDEISMVPYLTLKNVHVRLQQLKQDRRHFGGINVILFGDLMQLPPVSKITGGAYCFRQPAYLIGETDLWQIFDFCELPQNMRQAGDSTFVDILNNIRVGELTMDQLEILDSRRVPLTGLFANGEAVRIFPTTRQVDSYNLSMTTELGKSIQLYQVHAVDISVEAKTYGKCPRKEFVSEDPNETGGILSTLRIGVGSRVMLRRNVNVNRGLVNGAMGVIRKIEWPALRRDQLETGELPQAVFVEFDDITINNNDPGVGVRIEPCTVGFDALRGQGKIERRMLPLILSWAVTVHKLQGTTLDRAVVDLGSRIFAKGQAYVALSRVKTLAGLAISDLDAKNLLHRPHDQNSYNELQRLRQLHSN